RNGVSTRNMNLCGAQWLAYVLLCRRFAAAFAGDRARLGVDVDRYSFIVSDLHRLLIAGLPAHCERFWTLPTVKPVGEPDAGDRHVRFDERGWETACCRMAQATAPILDSTFSAIHCCSLHGRFSGAIRRWKKGQGADGRAFPRLLRAHSERPSHRRAAERVRSVDGEPFA